MVVSYLITDNHFSRVGWTVPKFVGPAVVRNQLKRWGREFFRNIIDLDELSVDVNVYFRKKRMRTFIKS